MPDPSQRELEQVILRLLDERGPGKTICPSDAARAAYAGEGAGWRDLMDPVRDAARDLVAADKVRVTQKGEVVDLDQVKGPVRIGRAGD